MLVVHARVDDRDANAGAGIAGAFGLGLANERAAVVEAGLHAAIGEDGFDLPAGASPDRG